MKNTKTILDQADKMLNMINAEGNNLLQTTSFDDYDKIAARLEQLRNRAKRIPGIATALRDAIAAIIDCKYGVYDKFYRYNRDDEGQAYDKAWETQNQITQNEMVKFLYS